MDFVEAINDLTKHLDGVYWHIEGIASYPELKDFQKQDTDMKTFPVEFIKGQGDADYGFNGTIYFPIASSDNALYLHVTFSG